MAWSMVTIDVLQQVRKVSMSFDDLYGWFIHVITVLTLLTLLYCTRCTVLYCTEVYCTVLYCNVLNYPYYIELKWRVQWYILSCYCFQCLSTFHSWLCLMHQFIYEFIQSLSGQSWVDLFFPISIYEIFINFSIRLLILQFLNQIGLFFLQFLFLLNFSS